MIDEISNSLGLAPMDEVVEGNVVVKKDNLPDTYLPTLTMRIKIMTTQEQTSII